MRGGVGVLALVPHRGWSTDAGAVGAMKLARKLTWAIIVGMSLILVASGLLRIRREGEMSEEDIRHDHLLIGQAAGRAVAEAPEVHEWSQALARVAATLEQSGGVKIRRVDSAPPGLSAVHEGRFISYVPLPADSPVRGFIEVSESLDDELLYRSRSIWRILETTVVMAVIASVLAMALGYKMVGFPIRLLADKARRVGAGDLGQPLVLRQRDELGDLAREMNLMSERLAEANARIVTESRARVAAIEALRHADRLATVGKLASGIAHEMGTPLNVISARGKMIADRDGTPDELAEYGRIVVVQSERITRIIRQLLDFARGQVKTAAASRPPSTAPVDLAVLARNTCLMLAPLAGKRQVALAVDEGAATEGGPGRALLASGDRTLVEQALANLIVNAIQASAPGGTITLGLGAEKRLPPPDVGGAEAIFVYLSVSDQGAGIDPRNLLRVFEPFFTTKDVGEGTGLGLSVAHGIVRDHGGWIAVESQLGHGSRFTIFLPARAVEG